MKRGRVAQRVTSGDLRVDFSGFGEFASFVKRIGCIEGRPGLRVCGRNAGATVAATDRQIAAAICRAFNIVIRDFSKKRPYVSANLRAGFPSRAFEFRLLYIALQRILTIEISLAASHAPGPLMLDYHGHSRTAGESRSGGRASFLCKAGGAALVAACVVAAYWPCLRGGFILDDDKLVTDNDLVRSPEGLGRIWFSTQAQDYWPLTNSLFWLQWRMWDTSPIGYHATSLLLHVAAALLIWRILRILNIPGAFLAGLLFAVHPVNVQSVAWISEQKNTLAMVLFLLSVMWYLRAEEGREARDVGRTLGMWYWLSLATFLLAMLSKGSAAVLPLVLLLIIWWRRADHQGRFLADGVIFRRRHRSYGR